MAVVVSRFAAAQSQSYSNTVAEAEANARRKGKGRAWDPSRDYYQRAVGRERDGHGRGMRTEEGSSDEVFVDGRGEERSYGFASVESGSSSSLPSSSGSRTWWSTVSTPTPIPSSSRLRLDDTPPQPPHISSHPHNVNVNVNLTRMQALFPRADPDPDGNELDIDPRLLPLTRASLPQTLGPLLIADLILWALFAWLLFQMYLFWISSGLYARGRRRGRRMGVGEERKKGRWRSGGAQVEVPVFGRGRAGSKRRRAGGAGGKGGGRDVYDLTNSYATTETSASRRSRFGLRVRTNGAPPVFNPFSNPRYGRQPHHNHHQKGSSGYGYDFYQADADAAANAKGRNINPWTVPVSAHPDSGVGVGAGVGVGSGSAVGVGVGFSVTTPGGTQSQQQLSAVSAVSNSKGWGSVSSFDPYSQQMQMQMRDVTQSGGNVHSPTSPESGGSFGVGVGGGQTSIPVTIPVTSPLSFRKHKKSSEGLMRSGSMTGNARVQAQAQAHAQAQPQPQGLNDAHDGVDGEDDDADADADQDQANQATCTPCSRRIIGVLVLALAVLVGVQAGVLTAYVWKAVVGGGELGLEREVLGSGWMLVVAGDVVGPVVFTIALTFFGTRLLFLSLYPTSSQYNTSSNDRSSHPTGAFTSTSTSATISPLTHSGYGYGTSSNPSPSSTSALRPLSLLKQKLSLNGLGVGVVHYEYGDRDRRDRNGDGVGARGNNVSGGYNNNNNSGNTRGLYNYGYDYDYERRGAGADDRGWGNSHVQPVPTRWRRIVRCVDVWVRGVGDAWRRVWSRGEGRRGSRRLSGGEGGRVGVSGGADAGTANWGRVLWVYGQPVLLALAALVVGICGLANGGKILDSPPMLGTPPQFNGVTAVWLVGSAVLNGIVFVRLITEIIRTHFALRRRIPFLALAVRVIGEAGLAQFVVSVLSLVLVLVYRNSTSPSSVPYVPALLLPALYSNAVLLNITQSYAFFATGPRKARPFDADPEAEAGTSTAVNPRRPLNGPATLAQRNVSGTGALDRKTPSPTSNEKDIIEMTPMRGIASIERSNSRTTKQVLNLSAAASVSASPHSASGSGTGTNSSADTSTGCTISAALRHHASNLRCEQQAAKEAETAVDANAPRSTSQLSTPNPPITATRMYLEREAMGETSVTNANLSVGSPGESGNNATRKRASGISQLSDAAMSLELPVFRKGHREDWDEWDDDEYLSDASSVDDGLSADGDGGAWDYGYAWAQAMMERERERERAEKERATQMQSATNASFAGTGLAAAFYNNWQQKQRQQQQQRQQQALRVHRDSIPAPPPPPSRNNHGHGAPTSYRATAHVPPRIDEGEDMIFAPPNEADTFDQYHFSPSMIGDDNSIMIISSAGAREPSIVEPSVYKAASVAATRASTGSLLSTYTYPKPMAFPDLDEDLQGGPSGENTFFYDLEPAGNSTGAIADALTANVEQDLGDGPAVGTGPAAGTSAHPYAAAADGVNNAQQPTDRSKRRLNVHPLKRMAEMGRFRR